MSDQRFWLPALFAGTFFLAAVSLLHWGYVHEDAYILFQYSRRLAQGAGITFDAASGPMEGATDFLWMAGLAALHAIGFEIALAAAALNALGMGVILAILARLRGRADALFFACACAVLLSGGTAAALGGFSTLAYGGLFSLLLYCALQANIPAVLILSLLMALFRPDGVILGSGVVLALFFQSTKTDRVRMLWLSLPAILLGSAYFLWRMQYFGMPLPLPLFLNP